MEYQLTPSLSPAAAPAKSALPRELSSPLKDFGAIKYYLEKDAPAV